MYSPAEDVPLEWRQPHLLDCSRIRRDICAKCFLSYESCCSRADWILLSCLFLSGKPRCGTFQAHTCRARKIVIDKTFGQGRTLFLQLWPALFQGWVYMTRLLFRSGNQGVRYSRRTLSALDCSYSRWLFVQTVFAVANCAVVGLSVFYFSVLTCSLIFLQLWVLGGNFECILHLHFKLGRWYFNTITY